MVLTIVTVEVACAVSAERTIAMGMIQKSRKAVVTRSSLSGWSTLSRAAYNDVVVTMASQQVSRPV